MKLRLTFPDAGLLDLRLLSDCLSVRGARVFEVADIQDVGYWVAKIESEHAVMAFIIAYGYEENFDKLVRLYRGNPSPYRNWHFFPNTMIGQLIAKLHVDARLEERNKRREKTPTPPQ